MIDATLLDKTRRLDRRFKMFAEMAEDPPDLSEFDFCFSAKDNLCTTDFQARAGSRILEGYRPPFDATPVKRMREAGGFLLGKTNMDEFGFGSFCTNSAYGVPRNPFDPERCCGGSSGGAAAAASLIDGHVALGVSTGGSISCPASFCGVVGFTPTYGRVSRYGLIDYANSLDKVGLLARSSVLIRRYLKVISGADPKDPTSCAQPPLDSEGGAVRSIGMPVEVMDSVRDDVRKEFDRALALLSSELGVEVKEMRIPSLRYALPAYYVLATSEASTNLARYCGMRFGVKGGDVRQHFNDYFSEVRSERFGKEAKRRILLGTYSRMVGFRSRYYMKALAVRQMIIRDFAEALSNYDLVITPTMPFVAPRLSEIEDMRPLDAYRADVLTVPPNLAGLPHVSMPCGYVGSMPVGMQAVATHWDEGRLLRFADMWEGIFGYRSPEVI